MRRILNEKFLSAMCYYDTVEAFYHGVTLTLLQLNPDYYCVSNRESGSGRFDVCCRQKKEWKWAFILEFKVTEDPREMINDANQAVSQIRDKEYISDLKREGYEKILIYGFSFCAKRCRVVQGKLD